MTLLLEKLIVYRYISHLLGEGYRVQILDPEDAIDSEVRTARQAADLHGEADMLNVRVSKDGRYVGWMLFITGNDVDVLSDYSSALDGMLDPIHGEIESDSGLTDWVLDRMEAK